jgi:hypothetical protein
MSEAGQANNTKPFIANPALVELCNSIVEGVRSGRISSMACITVSPLGNVQWPGSGMQVGELMLGAEMMRDDMKQAMRGRAAASKILQTG